MTAKLKKLTPNLMVEDVNRTVEFYKDVLDFTLLATVPEEGTYNWAMMKSDGVEIMFQSIASLSDEYSQFRYKAPGGTLNLYIDVENVQGLYEAVHNRATLLHHLHKTFYGAQEFAIQDCNGYVLTFAETETASEAEAS
jgi:lactoylglutathione lyase